MADINSIKEPNAFGDDLLAKQESKNLYSKTKQQGDLQTAFHRVFIIFIYIVSVIGIFIIAVRLLHLILPSSQQWLTDVQIQAVDKIFFSGAIGGFIANYVKKAQ